MIVPRISCSLLLLVTFAVSLQAADVPFEAATRPPYSPPPEKSINGKRLADMKAVVKKEWNNIQFKQGGKPIEYVVTMDTDAGEIRLEFFPNEAPSHVRSFIGLTKAGFYDGLIFHRCIPGFVIQGGCSQGTGSGGPGYCVKQEFNNRKHTRGILSMARAAPVDSGGSQFFVCVANVPALDSPSNRYTVFGHVTRGMDVVDRIVAAPTGSQDRPLKPVKIKKATVSIKGEK